MRATHKEMIAFLEEGINYYRADTRRRSIKNGVCYYNPLNTGNSISEGCFIGRQIEPKLRKSISQRQDAGRVNSFFRCNPELIPAKLLKYPIDFLMACQNLHDTDDNWSEAGMTGYGCRQYNGVMENIKDGYYDDKETVIDII